MFSVWRAVKYRAAPGATNQRRLVPHIALIIARPVRLIFVYGLETITFRRFNIAFSDLHIKIIKYILAVLPRRWLRKLLLTYLRRRVI